jgi:uncharacterized protein YbjT (DUF2867 family)
MIVITGATGNTGRAATEALLAKGHNVRVIGRDAARLDPFVQRGAEPFVANLEDAAALKKAFEGADAVYLAIPQALHREDLPEYQERLSDSFAAAVTAARVPHVVTLSSIGAQHAEKTGAIIGLHKMEQKLNGIPGRNVLHLRPTSFMENLLTNIGPLRSMGFLPGAFPGDAPLPMIATQDIGSFAAERLHARDFTGASTQELFGPRDVTMKEVAALIGSAIGKPNLHYMQVAFLVLEPALVQMGMAKKAAALLIEMWKSANAGLIKPEEPRSARNTTPTAIESWVQEVFAPAYNAKATAAGTVRAYTSEVEGPA